MQLKFGTYSFNPNACEVTSQTSVIRSQTGRPLRYKTAIHVKAYLETALGQAACSALEIGLRAALLVPYQTLSLAHDDGSPSSLTINSNASISGVVITDGPHFGEAMDAEFVNRRTAEFSGEAEYVILNTATAIVSFSETVNIIGNGGPVMGWRHPVNAKPVPQMIFPASTFKASQSGKAVGHGAYPPAAALLFPQIYLKNESSRVTRENPRRIGPAANALIEYPISWQYDFEADVPLVGFPNVPPL